MANVAGGRVIYVLLISPLEITRSSLRFLLESHRGIRVLEAATCRAAMAPASVRPNVLLFEHGPESSTEMELLPQVIEVWQNLPLLILAGTRDAEVHCALMRLGAMGMVLKTDPVEHLFRAIERVNAREVSFEPSVMEAILTHLTGRHTGRPPGPPPNASLTSRETEVIRLVASEALSNRQIGQRLFISETTVRHHLNSVFGKLGVSSRLELMKYAYTVGLAKPTSAPARMAQTARSA